MKLEASIVKRLKDFTLTASFTVEHGEIVGLLGESGCGKSMTLKCIAGIVSPDSGKIVLNDTVLFDSEQHINLPVQQRNAGYMFQSYALFPSMTVMQNVCCGIKDRKHKKDIAQHFLEMLHIAPLASRYPRQLSGGQQQRVALARLLAASPSLIMLDEPFSALDAGLKDSLHEELKSTLERAACPVLFVSHNPDEVERYCSRTLHIRNGSVEA
ncbi:MAG: sulfate/molybdate ABC transporter ATP-binding protein [Treponema sp.]